MAPFRSILCVCWISCFLLLLNSSANVKVFAKKGSWAHKDWLLHKDAGPATIQENICWEDGLCGLELSNGLLTRRWTLQNKPAFGTVDLLMRDKAGSEISMLRAIEPEAWVAIDGKEYRVGDLIAKNGFRAYLNRTSIQESLQSIPQTQNNCTFRYASHRITKIRAPFSWTPGTRHSLRQEWPPPGIGLEVDLRLEGINMTQTRPILVTLHYELYDGIPVMAKWLTVTLHDSDNDDDDSDESTKKSTQFIINSVNIERIASYPPYGAYLTQGSSPPFLLYNGESSGVIRPPPLLVSFTDQAHGAQCQWIDDYLNSNDTDTSEPHDMGASEPLLTCNYTLGPHAVLRSTQIENSQGKHHDRLPQSIFTSFKTFLLATDTSDPERQTLMKHRMTQVLLPHTTENPLFFHFLPVVHSEAEFRRAVDQMTEVGFEMLIYSFGAGFQLESSDATYLEYIKRQVGYAKVHNIEVGGYDLICLQRGHGGYGENLPDEWVRINDHGDLSQDVCYGSKWYNKLNELVFHFINTTGLSMLEMDGPYGGSSCSSKDHAHHHGLEDSVYQQMQLQGIFFRRLREMGVYLNAPDTYFYQGQNRAGMGYNEHQYSLPRWKQLTISRMGMYDDFYRFLPTQGWMFVPLSEYHGGGEAATFANHPEELEWALAQYLGAGTAACYRGPYLYDESTEIGLRIKSIMKHWIQFYKMHRETLIQPVVHLRRPTVHGWDGWLHVHPFGEKEVGLAMIFNPTNRQFSAEEINLPLYYTALHSKVLIAVDDTTPFETLVKRDYSVTISLNMAPKSIHTIILERPSIASSGRKLAR